MDQYHPQRGENWLSGGRKNNLRYDIWAYLCAQILDHVQLLAILWTVACIGRRILYHWNHLVCDPAKTTVHRHTQFIYGIELSWGKGRQRGMKYLQRFPWESREKITKIRTGFSVLVPGTPAPFRVLQWPLSSDLLACSLAPLHSPHSNQRGPAETHIGS